MECLRVAGGDLTEEEEGDLVFAVDRDNLDAVAAAGAGDRDYDVLELELRLQQLVPGVQTESQWAIG